MIVLQAWNLDWLNKQDYLKELYLLKKNISLQEYTIAP